MPEPVFLGPLSDHFIDRDGSLTIEQVSKDSGLFKPADGKVPNYGVSTSTKSGLWLRVAIPQLGNESPSWVLSLDETRFRSAELFTPMASGWRERIWNYEADITGRPQTLRFPVFLLGASEVSGKTIFIRISSASTLQGGLWLRTTADFLNRYSINTVLFGLLFGVLLSLFIYLLTIGAIMRDTTLLSLSLMIVVYLAYAVAERAFLETMILPGALILSRMLSFPGGFFLLASLLVFQMEYLRLRHRSQWLTRLVWTVVVLLVIGGLRAMYDVTFGIQFIRPWTPYVGLSVLILVMVIAGIAGRYDMRRSLLFLACWLPTIFGYMARYFVDLNSLGANPIANNTTFFTAAFSLLLTGIMVSLDLQMRERNLHKAVELSEARFRSFAGSASDGFWETDAAGIVTYASGATSQTMGLRSGAGLHDILGTAMHPETGNASQAVHAAIGRQQAFRAARLELANADNPIAVELSGTPVFGAEGEFLGYRGIVADMTEETKRRNREAQQQKMAAVGQLAGGIAHEINNLLHPILNLSRRVAAQFSEHDENRRQLDIVIGAGTKAGEIVSNVLSFARPDASEAERLPFLDSARKAVGDLKLIVPNSVDLQTLIEGEGGPDIGYVEFFQVVSNLVANAIHATNATGRIRVSALRDSGGALHLVVEDNGSGMDAATRERAIEPFFTTKQPGVGTGLGLPIVYGIVRGWGGSIDIDSRIGEGTKMIVTVPALATETSEKQHA